MVYCENRDAVRIWHLSIYNGLSTFQALQIMKNSVNKHGDKPGLFPAILGKGPWPKLAKK